MNRQTVFQKVICFLAIITLTLSLVVFLPGYAPAETLPAESIAEKYALAPDHDDRLGGDLSHIVIMQHVTKDRLQLFLNDLANQDK